MTMITLFCVAAESNSSGTVDWHAKEVSAQRDYTFQCADLKQSADTITLFSIEVPSHTADGEKTELADAAMWGIDYHLINRRVGTDNILYQKAEEACPA